jgi:circadian clock protein KaiA
LSSSLTIAVLIESLTLAQSLRESLADGRYSVLIFSVASDFLNFIEREKLEVDCLIFQVNSQALVVVDALYQQSTVLPAVFLHSVIDNFACPEDEQPASRISQKWPDFLYHASEVFMSDADLINIGVDIDQAITKFLNLTPLLPPSKSPQDLATNPDYQPAVFLLQQQRRLSEKLKERLGYLAVYYNRNSNNFFRNLPRQQRQDLKTLLQEQYQQIALAYFSPDSKLNDLLDQFVTLVFFADMSVSDVVEIHMDLMDDFANRLKIEGWNEDILLDYRLTLIDVIAHLCEIYRRSIPAEESKDALKRPEILR